MKSPELDGGNPTHPFELSHFLFVFYFPPRRNKKINAPQPQRQKRVVRNSAPKLANGIKLQSPKHLSWRSSFRNGLKYPFQPGLQRASESHQYCSDAFISLALIWLISPALAAVYFFPLIPVSVIFQCSIHTHCTSVCRFLKDRSPWNRIPPPLFRNISFLSSQDLFPCVFRPHSCLVCSFSQSPVDLHLSKHAVDWSPAVSLVDWSDYMVFQSKPAPELTTAAALKIPSERLTCGAASIAFRWLLCELPSKSLNWWNVNVW